MKKTTLLFLVALMITSCQEYSTFKEHKTRKISIEIRDDLKETEDLNDEAILQFKNEFKELYLIVLEDPKVDVAQYFPEIINEKNPKKRIERYADILAENYETNLDLQNHSGYTHKIINGLNAIEMTFNAVESENDVTIFYYVTFIETDSHFYQILTWTLFNKKTDALESMKKMVNSFKNRDQKMKLKKATKR